MTLLLALGCTVLCAAIANAQQAAGLQVLNGVDQQVAYAVGTFGTDLYFVGSTQGTVLFFPELTSAGGDDAFVAKMGDGGNYQWVRRAGGTLNDVADGVAVDDAGYVYVVGHFRGTADFSGTPLVSNGDFDVFVAKYSSAGALVWATGFGGGDLDTPCDIAVDGTDHLYVTGEFADTMQVGATILASNGGSDVFVVKYDSSGAAVWATNGGSPTSDQGHGVAVDAAGDVVVVGMFTQTAAFGTANIASAGSGDVFAVKYHSSGPPLWVVGAGGNEFDRARDVALGSTGTIHVTGQFAGTADFGADQVSSNGNGDVFVWKLSSVGGHVWVSTGGGPENDEGNSIDVDPSDGIVVTGGFSGAAEFGSSVASYGFEDVFVTRLSSTGAFLWAQSGGGSGTDRGYGVATDAVGRAWVVGLYSGFARFGGVAASSVGGFDAFIARYELNDPTPVVDTPPVPAALGQNIPNPFSASTRISVDANAGEWVRLEVFDALGKRLRTLYNGPGVARDVLWDGRNSDGSPAPSGIYFYRLSVGDRTAVRKMTILR